LIVEPRAVDPHCFDAYPDLAQNLDADPDPGPAKKNSKILRIKFQKKILGTFR
jgi:hypothetical protein